MLRNGVLHIVTMSDMVGMVDLDPLVVEFVSYQNSSKLESGGSLVNSVI